MKIVLTLCLFLVSVYSFSQHGTLKVEKHDDFLPRIAGRAGGDISRLFLCDSEGITIGHNSKVVSFVFYSLDKNNQEVEIKIEGNKLTDDHCKTLISLPEGAAVYFQEIIVESKGVQVKVSPMMFFISDED
jgi:hypothetical protein